MVGWCPLARISLAGSRDVLALHAVVAPHDLNIAAFASMPHAFGYGELGGDLHLSRT
jgi:hypothetical protein